MRTFATGVRLAMTSLPAFSADSRAPRPRTEIPVGWNVKDSSRGPCGALTFCETGSGFTTCGESRGMPDDLAFRHSDPRAMREK